MASAAPDADSEGRSSRSQDHQWWRRGPPKSFTSRSYFTEDKWREQVTEAEQLQKAELMRSFEATYEEFRDFETTQLAPALQTEQDLTDVCDEAQRIMAKARLYGALMELTGAGLDTWNKIVNSCAQLKAAYKQQLKSQSDQKAFAAKISPSRLDQANPGGTKTATKAGDEQVLEPEKERREQATDVEQLKLQLENYRTNLQKMLKEKESWRSSYEMSQTMSRETTEKLERENDWMKEQLAARENTCKKLLDDIKNKEMEHNRKHVEMAAKLHQVEQEALEKDLLGEDEATVLAAATEGEYEKLKKDPMVRRILNDLQTLLEAENEDYEPMTDFVAFVYDHTKTGALLENEEQTAEFCLFRFGTQRMATIIQLWHKYTLPLTTSNKLYGMSVKIKNALDYLQALLLQEDSEIGSVIERPLAATKPKPTGTGPQRNKSVSFLGLDTGNETWLKNLTEGARTFNDQHTKRQVYAANPEAVQHAPSRQNKAFDYMNNLAGGALKVNTSHFVSPPSSQMSDREEEDKGPGGGPPGSSSFRSSGGPPGSTPFGPSGGPPGSSPFGASEGNSRCPPFRAFSTPLGTPMGGSGGGGGGDPPGGPGATSAGAGVPPAGGDPNETAMLGIVRVLDQITNKLTKNNDHPKMNLKMDRVKLPVYKGNEEHFVFWFRDFYEMVLENQVFTDWEKKFLLKSHLSTEIQDSIYGGRSDSLTLEDCLKALVNRYAQPDKVCASLRKALKNLTPPKDTYDFKGAFKMVQECRKHISALSIYGVNQEQINYTATDGILDKLPKEVAANFAQIGFTKNSKNLRSHSIQELLKLIEDWAMVGNDLQLDQSKPDPPKGEKKDKKAKAAPAATPHTTLTTGQQKNRPKGTQSPWCPLCKSNDHRGYMCMTYKTPEQKRDRFVDAKLCFYCAKVLGHAHEIKECQEKKECPVKNPDGNPCGQLHHSLLHNYLRKHKSLFPQGRPGEPQPQQPRQKSGSGSNPSNQEQTQGNGSGPQEGGSNKK